MNALNILAINRIRRIHFSALAVMLCLTTAAVAQDAAGEGANAYHEQGRKIYNFRCYYCHGYSGNARTLATSYLNPKPRDFTATTTSQLSRDTMLDAARNGKPGTAMKSFRGILKAQEIEAVTDFIRSEFIVARAPNTHYHTEENGWINHNKYKAAFPFVLGQIPLDAPNSDLSPEQEAGRQLFRSSCVTCHDQPNTAGQSAVWESHPLSYPRNNYPYGAVNGPVDAIASASPYLKHEEVPHLGNVTTVERLGETLFQKNCSFCHGADGTGRNWIGSYLEPHARDLTQTGLLVGLTRKGLQQVIINGVPETSMPAWGSVLSKTEVRAVAAYVFRAFAKTANPSK